MASSSPQQHYTPKDPRHQLHGVLLLDPTLKELIHRSQLWKHHVANSSLRWVVAKVSYAETVSRTSEEKGQPITMSMGAATVVPSAGAVALNPLMLAGGSLTTTATNSAAASSAGGKRGRDEDDDYSSDDDGNTAAPTKGAASSASASNEDTYAALYYGSSSASSAGGASSSLVTSSSSTGLDLMAGVDKPIHRAPHVLYMGTFYEMGKVGGEGSASSMAAKKGGGSASIASSAAYNPILNGELTLRPELFLCLLYRALQLSKQINSMYIVEMVEQTAASRRVVAESSASSDAASSTPTTHDLSGNKYLRVFGLFLARLLLGQRGEPQLLKRCWDAAKTDFRRVRVMKKVSSAATTTGNGTAPIITTADDQPVTVMRVDEVAYMLLTTDRWDRIVFPPCKPL